MRVEGKRASRVRLDAWTRRPTGWLQRPGTAHVVPFYREAESSWRTWGERFGWEASRPPARLAVSRVAVVGRDGVSLGWGWLGVDLETGGALADSAGPPEVRLALYAQLLRLAAEYGCDWLTLVEPGLELPLRGLGFVLSGGRWTAPLPSAPVGLGWRVVLVPHRLAQAHVSAHHSHLRRPLPQSLFDLALVPYGQGQAWRRALVADPQNWAASLIARLPAARVTAQTRNVVEVARVAVAAPRGRPVEGHATGETSLLLGAAGRIALLRGFGGLTSSVLLGETGRSYVAAGWCVTGLGKGGTWASKTKHRAAPEQGGEKVVLEWGPGAKPCSESAARRAAEAASEVAAGARTLALVNPRRSR